MSGLADWKKIQKSFKNTTRKIAKNATSSIKKGMKIVGGYMSKTKRVFKKKGKNAKARKTHRYMSSLLPNILNK